MYVAGIVQLNCAFVFAYAKSRVSHNAAHFRVFKFLELTYHERTNGHVRLISGPTINTKTSFAKFDIVVKRSRSTQGHHLLIFVEFEYIRLHANKNIKMSSFKSSENIHKKEGGPDRSVSDNLNRVQVAKTV